MFIQAAQNPLPRKHFLPLKHPFPNDSDEIFSLSLIFPL